MNTAKERIGLMVDEHRAKKPRFEKVMADVETSLKGLVGTDKRRTVHATSAAEEKVLKRVYEELQGTPGLVVTWIDTPRDPRDHQPSFAYISVGFEEL